MTNYSLDVYENTDEDFISSCNSDSYVRIDYIIVDEADRGKGIGRKLLKKAIAEAESYNLPIYIIAEDIEETTDIERLVSFYESEGFDVECSLGDGVLMSY